MSFNTIPEIIEDIRAGRMVVILDDEDRENEGDLVRAAEKVRPEDVNFMVREARGLLCLTLTEQRTRQLGLRPMVSVSDNTSPFRTNFTVSIEAAEGVTTGISAHDRARTLQVAIRKEAKPADISQPGHIFPLTAQPGGVLTRAGHTEAGCDLAALAGLEPAAATIEVLHEDGSMARRPQLEAFAARHGLKIGTIADLIRYRLATEQTVEGLHEEKNATGRRAPRSIACRDQSVTAIQICLLAPSGYPHDDLAITRGIERLQAAGCHIDGREVLACKELRFAGSDVERAKDINHLATLDQLPDIALAIRGGYGATRLLENLHYDALRERLESSPLVICGHSDFTALQLALYARSDLSTFAGPMLGPDFGAENLSDFTWRHFWDTVRVPTAEVTWLCPNGMTLPIEGLLWGGNLAVLCNLIGTPYFPDIDGGILFLEDVGESPFRIERYLYQLHLAGILRRQQALLLGSFSQCVASPYDNGYDLSSACAQIRAVAGIPVLEGFTFGHQPDKFTLPFGVPARLICDSGQARLRFTDYPHLPAGRAPNLVT